MCYAEINDNLIVFQAEIINKYFIKKQNYIAEEVQL